MLDFARRVQEHEQLHNVVLTVGDGLLLAWPAPGVQDPSTLRDITASA